MSNSPFWCFGPAIFLSHEQLQNSTYATFCKEAKRFVIIKHLSTKTSMGSEIDKGQVKDVDQVCLTGSQQQPTVEGCKANKMVHEEGGVTQNLQASCSEINCDLLETCSPTTGGASTELELSPSLGGPSTQPMHSPGTKEGEVEKVCSQPATSLTCEDKQVQSLQVTSLHASERIMGTDQQASGNLAKGLAHHQELKVTPVPSCNV